MLLLEPTAFPLPNTTNDLVVQAEVLLEITDKRGLCVCDTLGTLGPPLQYSSQVPDSEP